jgi:hypothetical protein
MDTSWLRLPPIYYDILNYQKSSFKVKKLEGIYNGDVYESRINYQRFLMRHIKPAYRAGL